MLGANQIKVIENLDALSNLIMLSLPANAIVKMGVRFCGYSFVTKNGFQNLEELTNLKEVYLSQNGIKDIRGLDGCPQLEVLDLNYNRIERVSNVAHLQCLTDFWARHNQLADFAAAIDELAKLPKLSLVYLEFNPIAKQPDYRDRVIAALPTLKRLDADYCHTRI